ncbi:MAG: peptidoglycan DD-metalloendopeptidase family protein [Firmicutes bacterium]|nr:peptidoglycan DD-metalloendopeptidase family protein [Bacillota bacterium]
MPVSAKSSAYMEEFDRANKKKSTSFKRSCIAVPQVNIPKTKIGPTTWEKEQNALQKEKAFNITKSIIVVVLVVVAVITSILAYMEHKRYKPAVKVYVGGNLIGIVRSEQEFYEYMAKVKNELSMYLENDVLIEQTPIYQDTKVKEEFFTPPERVEKNLRNIVDISVGAYVITVNGKQMGFLKERETADAILEELKAPFVPEDSSIKIGFTKDVQVKKEYVKVGKIQNREEVVNALSALEEEIKTYKVKQNDTLWDIALDYKIPVEEIARINPEISENIHPGDEIKLNVPKPFLGIETREKVVYNEDIPFEIKEVDDPDLYKGRRTIVEKGLNGEKKVEAEIIRVNGIENGKEVIKELVLAQPKTQTEKVGTKPVPPKYGTGSFRRPLYGTLTSRFGMRWGRMHTGIDISGNVGVPIYAADGGKVIFAGWMGNYGYLVKVHHDNEYVTYYAHCSKILVKTGQRVAKGEVIAKVGNTGRSQGPHLHFEVRKNGSPENPLKYVP